VDGLSSFIERWKWFLVGGLVAACVSGYLVASQTTWLPAYLRLAAPPAPQAATRDERWHQDVRYLASQLPRLHVDAFHTVGREEFERDVTALDAAVPELSDIEIVLEILRIVATVGDAHTQAVPPATMALRLVPLRLYWLADGFYVVGATPEYQDLVGSRVVQIGDVPIRDVCDRVKPFVAHETESGFWIRSWLYLLSPNILRQLSVLGDARAGAYTFERPDGTRTTRELDTIGSDTYFSVVPDTLPANEPLYRRHADAFYWFEYLEAEGTVYLHYRKCQDMESLAFRDLVADLFGFIDAHAVSRLVIDVRHNGGGDSEHVEPLFEELARRPFLDQEGHLFVIVGRGTYSSAVLNVVEFEHRTHAIFVGEAPSSVPDHYGQVASFVLPNSRVRVDYSTKRFPMTKLASGEKLSLGDWLGVLGYSSARFPLDAAGTGSFEPDVPASPTITDYLTGRDPALEAILGR